MTGTAAERVDQARDRLSLAAHRFVNSAKADIPAAAIDRALAAKDTLGFFVELLLAAPVTNPADACMREQQINAARFKRDMAEAAGGLFDAGEAAELLGYSSAAAVYKAVKERRLLAVDDGGRMKLPACQFADGAPVPGLRNVLLAAPNTTGWRMLQYLLVPEDGLNGRRPIDLLRSGKAGGLDAAVRFASRLED